GPSLLENRWLRSLVTPDRWRRIEGHFERHGLLTVVVARHLPGVRAACFAVAGATGMRTRHFAIADALSAAATIPLVGVLAALFSERMARAGQRYHEVRPIFLSALGALLVAIFLWRWLRRRRRTR